MKRTLSVLLALVMCLSMLSFAIPTAEAAGSVAVNSTNFPDEAFRNYVTGNLDKDGNGTLSAAEIAAVLSIRVNGKGITSIKGVEHFNALEELYCGYNQLTALDVSKNTALKLLSCYSNQLTALNVSKNTKLETLDCSYNQLTGLDVSKNTGLQKLD